MITRGSVAVCAIRSYAAPPLLTSFAGEFSTRKFPLISSRMKKPQFFAHRPPSKITLLNDAWPTRPQPRNPQKISDWPFYRESQELVDSRKADHVVGLQA
jgi:hypothetical protein